MYLLRNVSWNPFNTAVAPTICKLIPPIRLAVRACPRASVWPELNNLIIRVTRVYQIARLKFIERVRVCFQVAVVFPYR